MSKTIIYNSEASKKRFRLADLFKKHQRVITKDNFTGNYISSVEQSKALAVCYIYHFHTFYTSVPACTTLFLKTHFSSNIHLRRGCLFVQYVQIKTCIDHQANFKKVCHCITVWGWKITLLNPKIL